MPTYFNFTCMLSLPTFLFIVMCVLDAGKQAPPRAWGREKEQPPPGTKVDPQHQQAQQQHKWNNSPLPEWASDDSVTSTTVGTFDSSGNFTASAEKVWL